MEENWTKGGLNIAFHRAEINVSVHSCISTKSHRNKLKVWTNWLDMVGKQSGSVWLNIQNSIQWPSAFEGAGASALSSTSSAYMWNLLHVFSCRFRPCCTKPWTPPTSQLIYSYIFYCAQLVCSIVIYYDLTLPGNELKPMWKKFCNLVNAGPFLALDLLRTSHHGLLTWKKIGPGGV